DVSARPAPFLWGVQNCPSRPIQGPQLCRIGKSQRRAAPAPYSIAASLTERPMLKDLLKKECQRFWLLSGFSGAEIPTFAPAGAPRGKTHEGRGDQDNFDLSEQWLRAYHVLTIARASAGI